MSIDESGGGRRPPLSPNPLAGNRSRPLLPVGELPPEPPREIPHRLRESADAAQGFRARVR
jgi:hypothetical protein